MSRFAPLRRLRGVSHAESGRPQPGEYAAYADADIAAVDGEDIAMALERQGQALVALLTPLHDRDLAGVRYAPDKWTAKEVLGHMIDDERIFAYRCLCIARGDTRPLPGFDQDDYQRAARHEERPLRELVWEYVAVRSASVFFCWSLQPDEWLRRGFVSGYEASVRGLAFHIAGHELRHVRQLRASYFPHLLRTGGNSM